jgi:hypothetical protein
MVLRLKQTITHAPEMLKWIGTGPTGDDFEVFVDEICERLPGEVSSEAVYQSLMHLAGQEITERNFDASVWRLLANLDRLRDDRAVYPWSAQERDEWVPVQVLSVERQVSRKGDPGGDFALQTLTGSMCPMILKKFWTRKFASMFSRRLGFTAPWHDYPFRDILELVNFRFRVRVTQELSGKAPGFEEVEVAKNQVTWNRHYLRMRKRPPGGFHCPRDYPLNHLCYACHVGLQECPAAVHNRTYTQRACPGCNQADAWFDPSHRERDVCLDCFNQRLFKRRTEG